MAITCFGCGAEGYRESECPYCADVTDKRPTHCGQCDPRTRLLAVSADLASLKRCPQCHPQSRKPLVQHKRCPNCKMTVYAWDTSPCGMHESPVAPDRRLTIDEIHEIERRAS